MLQHDHVCPQRQTVHTQTFSKSASDRFLLASATHFRESVCKERKKKKKMSKRLELIQRMKIFYCETDECCIEKQANCHSSWTDFNSQIKICRHKEWYLSACVPQSELSTDEGLNILWPETQTIENHHQTQQQHSESSPTEKQEKLLIILYITSNLY